MFQEVVIACNRLESSRGCCLGQECQRKQEPDVEFGRDMEKLAARPLFLGLHGPFYLPYSTNSSIISADEAIDRPKFYK